MDVKEWRRVVREEKGAGKVEEEKEAHDRAWQGMAGKSCACTSGRFQIST